MSDQKLPSVNVTIKTLNEVLNYLASKPYNETAALISKVHQETLPQVQPKVENAPQEEKTA